MKSEFLSERERLIYRLNSKWSETFRLEKSEEKFTGENRLIFKLKTDADKAHFCQAASAMIILNVVQPKLKQLAAFFSTHLLEPLIEKRAVLLVDRFDDKCVQVRTCTQRLDQRLVYTASYKQHSYCGGVGFV